MRCLWFLLIGVPGLLAQSESSPMEYKFYGSAGTEGHVTPQNDSSPLNPGGVLRIPQYSDTTDLELFGDIMPESKKWKLHFKVRGVTEGGGPNTSQAQIDELYWNLSVTSWMDFVIGRKIENWGTGYGWNPTGVVNPPKNPTDPTDHLDTYRGVDQAAIDLFIRGWNISMLATPVIPWDGNTDHRPIAIGWAARAYRLIHGVDFSVSASGGSGLPDSQGVSVSRVFGKALELHAEAALFHTTNDYLAESDEFQTTRRLHNVSLVGGQYTFRHNVNLTVEYYHNGGSLSRQEWQDYRSYADRAEADLALGNPTTLAVANSLYTALAMGRDYVFNRVAWPIVLRKLDLETIAITSLRDGSSVLRPAVYWHLSPNWTAYVLQTEFCGNNRTELGFVPIRRETDVGVRFQF